MAGLYFEEFTVDRVFDHAWTRTVTEMEDRKSTRLNSSH